LEESCKIEQGELANVSLPGFTPTINFRFGVQILLAETLLNAYPLPELSLPFGY